MTQATVLKIRKLSDGYEADIMIHKSINYKPVITNRVVIERLDAACLEEFYGDRYDWPKSAVQNLNRNGAVYMIQDADYSGCEIVFTKTKREAFATARNLHSLTYF